MMSTSQKYTSTYLTEHKDIPALNINMIDHDRILYRYSISPYLKYRKILFLCPNFIIRNMVTPYILTFFHAHFVIRVLPSTFYHPPPAIRCHSILTLQRPIHWGIGHNWSYSKADRQTMSRKLPVVLENHCKTVRQINSYCLEIVTPRNEKAKLRMPKI